MNPFEPACNQTQNKNVIVDSPTSTKDKKTAPRQMQQCYQNYKTHQLIICRFPTTPFSSCLHFSCIAGLRARL